MWVTLSFNIANLLLFVTFETIKNFVQIKTFNLNLFS